MKVIHGVILFAFSLCIGFYLQFFGLIHLPLAPNNRATLYWCDERLMPEDVLAWVNPLKEEFKKRGYILDTQNRHPIGDSDIVLYVQTHIDLTPVRTKKLFIWALESPISRPQPLSKSVQRQAQKIFTWRRDLVDNEKTFYVPVVSRLTEGLKIDTAPEHKDVLLALVSRRLHSVQGIYSLRDEAIIWFLTHHPDDFVLYGPNWVFLKKELEPNLQSHFDRRYKGFVEDKYTALKSAKFTLAYENTSHTDYVSEKIYDVMQAGSVPVYLGAPNIADYVPKECFVNRRDFADYETLYAFLKNMPDEQYRAYLTCIQTFLDSDKIHALTGTYTAKKMAEEIFKGGK